MPITRSVAALPTGGESVEGRVGRTDGRTDGRSSPSGSRRHNRTRSKIMSAVTQASAQVAKTVAVSTGKVSNAKSMMVWRPHGNKYVSTTRTIARCAKTEEGRAAR